LFGVSKLTNAKVGQKHGGQISNNKSFGTPVAANGKGNNILQPQRRVLEDVSNKGINNAGVVPGTVTGNSKFSNASKQQNQQKKMFKKTTHTHSLKHSLFNNIHFQKKIKTNQTPTPQQQNKKLFKTKESTSTFVFQDPSPPTEEADSHIKLTDDISVKTRLVNASKTGGLSHDCEIEYAPPPTSAVDYLDMKTHLDDNVPFIMRNVVLGEEECNYKRKSDAAGLDSVSMLSTEDLDAMSLCLENQSADVSVAVLSLNSNNESSLDDFDISEFALSV